MQTQCEGRKTTPRSSPLFFESGPRLHKSKPLSFLGIVRCTNKADGLCANCMDRQRSTAYQLEKRAGKYIPNQETMFHGRIGDPIPKWSRLYKGEWFQAQLAAGYTLSDETRKQAENGVKELPSISTEMSDTAVVLPVKRVVHRKKVITTTPSQAVENPREPEPNPEIAPPPMVKKRQSKKVIGSLTPAPVAVPTVVPSPVPKSSEQTTLSTPAKPKRRYKKVTTPTPSIIGVVTPTPLEDYNLVKIIVKKVNIDGRSLYVSEPKDKVFDLKYNYLGRWNRLEDRVDTTFPDSDAEP